MMRSILRLLFTGSKYLCFCFLILDGDNAAHVYVLYAQGLGAEGLSSFGALGVDGASVSRVGRLAFEFFFLSCVKILCFIAFDQLKTGN